jgi:glucokinase
MHGRVSYERVASGIALREVYAFARKHVPRGAKLGPVVSATSTDANRTIVAQGLSGDCAAARMAVDLVIAVLGAEAGNLALRTGASGGIYVGGGLVEALAPRLLRTETFRDAFLDKGRFRPVMEKISVALVRAPLVGLRGAGRLAHALHHGDGRGGRTNVRSRTRPARTAL